MASDRRNFIKRETNIDQAPHPTIKMPTHPTDTQMRLNNIVTCSIVTADTLQILANSFHGPFLEALSNTTQSLLKNIEVTHSNECTLMMNHGGIPDCQTKQEQLY